MSLSDKVKFVNKSYDFSFANSKPFYPEKDVKEAIKQKDERIKNQLRIHWNWLKESNAEEVNKFVKNISDKKFGDELVK